MLKERQAVIIDRNVGIMYIKNYIEYILFSFIRNVYALQSLMFIKWPPTDKIWDVFSDSATYKPYIFTFPMLLLFISMIAISSWMWYEQWAYEIW